MKQVTAEVANVAKTVQAGSLILDVPCLDGLEPSDLFEVRADLKEIIEGLKELVSYAEAKAYAMQCRKEGKIDLAKRFEDAGDEVYKNRLPSWAKVW